MEQISKVTSYTLGGALIIGGLIGFISAQSVISLVVGSISGVLVFIACKLGEKKTKEGYLFIAAISLVIALFFATKFAESRILMPHGLMLTLSTTTFAVVGLNYLKSKKKSK